MHNDDTSVRALIAGYKACERPSEATAARIGRALEAAQRETPPPARRVAATPWLALAAALVLALLWRAGAAPKAVPKDRDSSSAYTAGPGPGFTTSVRPRTGTADAPASPPPSSPPAPAPLASPLQPSPPADAATARAASDGKRRRPASRPLAPLADDPVLAEMALLRRAQEALRAQQPEAALELLDHHARTYPRGDFTEEREALRVTALCTSGDPTRGLAARATFMRMYPRSTHAGRVAAACQDPESTDNSPSP